MGSKTTVHKSRIKKHEYDALLESINKEYFYNFYLNNCNDYVCKEFNINLNTVYKLVKDLNISLTDEQKRYKNKKASEQKSLEKLGVSNPFELKSVQNKVAETNKARYGTENVFAADEVKSKIKQFNLENYGVEHVSQRADVRQKVKDTCIRKYGVDNYAKTTECLEKTKITNLNKYGFEYTVQSPIIKEKANKTFLSKYGATRASYLDSVKEKARQTSLDKYGVTHYSKTFDFHNRIRKRYTFEDQTFDSLPELAVWVYCLDNNISIKRTPYSFQYTFGEKDYTYFPDFEINGKLIEIKGDHFFKEDGTMCNPFDHNQDDLYEAKHQCGLQNGVVFWRKTDYQQYIDYFNANYDISNYIFKKKGDN